MLTQLNDTYIRNQTSMTFPEKRNRFSQHRNFPIRHATTSCKKDLEVYDGQLFNEVALCTKARCLLGKYGLYIVFSKIQNSPHFCPVTLRNRIILYNTHIQSLTAIVFHQVYYMIPRRLLPSCRMQISWTAIIVMFVIVKKAVISTGVSIFDNNPWMLQLWKHYAPHTWNHGPRK